MLHRPHNTRPATREFFALLLCVAVSAGLMCGCQAPPRPTGPTAATLQLADYDTYLNETMSVLRRYDFDPRFVDRTRGTVLTEPTTAAQWFEFWRVDARGAYQTTEANLQTIQRRVRLDVTPTDPPEDPLTPPAGPGTYRVAVTVEKFSHDAPERQVTTASGALNLYTSRIPTTAGVRGPQSGRVNWIPMGRDPLLEEFLLQQFTGRAAEVTSVTGPAAE